MDIRSVPSKIFERVFTYFTFAQVSQFRGLSKNMHCAARQILNAAFLDLGPRLATQYTAHLIYTKNNNSDNASGDVAFRGRLLKLLGSEHSILLAFCRHYIMNGISCFSAGEILDLFYELQKNKSNLESQDEENNKVAKLVLLIDQYLDWFERSKILNDKGCSWFGASVIDLLDSYLVSGYHLIASHNGSSVNLTGQYMINGYTEAPPEIGAPHWCNISQNELLQVLRYLRKHARWHNFVKAFQNDFEKGSDLDEEQEKIYTKRKSSGYDKIYKKKPYGIVDSHANIISLRAVISLQCHKSFAPTRLSSCHDFKKSTSNHETDNAGNSSTDNSINDESMNLNMLVENACSPFVLMKNDGSSFNNHRPNDIYSFILELRSVHPKKWTGSNYGIGEKFGITTLNIKHTFDAIFAAQTECRLY